MDKPSKHKAEQLSAIINLLSDREWHKGPAIADSLSVSRAYVWKLIKQLQEYGLTLESVSGKGYRLKDHLELLEQEQINLALKEFEVVAEVLLVTNSTNENLKNEGFAHNRLLLAEYQSAGRGRRGRTWISPIASNLYWSLGWQTQMPVQKLGGLSLVVGLSLVTALNKLGLQGLELKWPNDLRYQGKKIGGILIELSGDAAGDLNVIIGVGLNLQMDSANGKQIEQAWTTIFELAQKQGIETISRQQVLVECIKQLKQNLNIFEQQGFTYFIEQWNCVDEAFNKPISIIQATNAVQGIGAGVDASGAFLLKQGDKVETIYAGEVSLRINS